MDCKDFNNQISLYIDEQLQDVDKQEFELHLLTCESCQRNYKYMLNILKKVKEDEEVELPDTYKTELRSKLKEASKERKTINWKMFSGVAAGFLVLMVSLALISKVMINTNSMGSAVREESKMEMDQAGVKEYDLTKSNNSDADFTLAEGQESSEQVSEAPTNIEVTSLDDTALDVQATMGSGEGKYSVKNTASRSGLENRKIIREAYVDIEIEVYDKIFDEILVFVKDNEGYIEQSNTSYRRYSNTGDGPNLKQGSLKIRIPEERFVETVGFLSNLGVVKNKQISEQDLTRQYHDVKNQVKNLEVQEKRLREILMEAKNVEEILQVENELRRVRTEIDSNTGVLQNWDNQVSMSTITASLREVERLDRSIKIRDNGIWSKAKRGFIATINELIELIENIIIKVITLLPVLLIMGVVVVVVYILIKRKRK